MLGFWSVWSHRKQGNLRLYVNSKSRSSDFWVVSLWLAALCWTKNYFYVKLLLNQGCYYYLESTLQLCASRIFCAEFNTVKSDPLHSSGRCGYSVRTLISQATFVWTTWLFCPDSHQCPKDSNCSRLHPFVRLCYTSRHHLVSADKGRQLQPSGQQVYTVRTPVLIMKIVCSWSATVQTLRQYRPDAILFKKEYQLQSKHLLEKIVPDSI
jgi:hypothetical protein